MASTRTIVRRANERTRELVAAGLARIQHLSAAERYRSRITLAAKITSTLEVPTVGIGAGPDCDGQVLVSSDLLGLHDKVPPFAKKYANLAEVIVNAARAFVADVQSTSPDRARKD